MAKGKVVPQEKRKEYVDEALETTVEATAEKYSLNKKTLRGWISKAGLSPVLSENQQKAIDASKQSFELRFTNLKDSMLTEAEYALSDMRKPYQKLISMKDPDGGRNETVIEVTPDPADRAKLATSFGILFDKLQLATGGSTSNTTVENPTLSGLIVGQREKNAQAKAALIAMAAGANS